MRFYTLSPNVPENPHLFPMMRQTFIDRGHSFVDSIEDADCVLFDFHSRIAVYNEHDIDFIVNSGILVATFDEWDRGGMSDDVWPNPQLPQQMLILPRALGKRVHFCRLLDKAKNYPDYLLPFEKPILHEEPLLTPEQLFERPYDIVWVANSAPQREHLKKVLEANAKLKCKIILGAEKIPFQDWVDAHKQGKFFVKWSAGGYGCEKMHNLFSVAAMIKEDNDQLLLHPFTNAVNCVTLSTNPTKQELDYLRLVCSNKEELYKLYRNNYDFMKTYYSKEYIASNILETILKHL